MPQPKTFNNMEDKKMSENETNGKSEEIQYNAPVVEFDNEKVVVTNIGFTAKTLDKYQIVWLIPANDAEAKERYDCTISDLVAAGVRQLSTRPNYKDVGFYNIGDKDPNGEKIENDLGTKASPKSSNPYWGLLKSKGHEAMQELADGYKVGQRQVGVGQKATVQKVKKHEDELGMSLDEMAAKIKELKEKGLLDD